MITIRKIGAPTAHRAVQDTTPDGKPATWLGAPLYTRTLCGREVKSGHWYELDPLAVAHLIGDSPAYLLHPCTPCARKAI